MGPNKGSEEPSLLPGGRKAKGVRHEAKIEALLKRMPGDAAKPLGEPFRIAVLAAGGDLGAATHRVPGRVSPLDGASVAHRAVRITNTRLNPFPIFQANTKGSPHRSSDTAGLRFRSSGDRRREPRQDASRRRGAGRAPDPRAGEGPVPNSGAC